MVDSCHAADNRCCTCPACFHFAHELLAAVLAGSFHACCFRKCHTRHMCRWFLYSWFGEQGTGAICWFAKYLLPHRNGIGAGWSGYAGWLTSGEWCLHSHILERHFPGCCGPDADALCLSLEDVAKSRRTTGNGQWTKAIHTWRLFTYP